MAAEHRVQVEGVPKALRILGALDRDLAKDIKRELKAAVQPVVAQAKAATPDRPLSNWGSWTTRRGTDLSYNRSQVVRGLKVVQRTSAERMSFTDTQGVKKFRSTRQIAFLQLRNESAAGHVFEIAGARQPGNTFNRNILARHGQPKRLLYRALEPREPMIEAQVRATIDRLEREVTRRLAR